MTSTKTVVPAELANENMCETKPKRMEYLAEAKSMIRQISIEITKWKGNWSVATHPIKGIHTTQNNVNMENNTMQEKFVANIQK